jgi:hydroxymethylglutaryl-CoA lyase
MADTVGLATAPQISSMLKVLIPQFSAIEIGVHLHSTIIGWEPKITAALQAGCNRFDGALKGIGGCPMANDELVGNIDTELMIPYFKALGLPIDLNLNELALSSRMAAEIFL